MLVLETAGVGWGSEETFPIGWAASCPFRASTSLPTLSLFPWWSKGRGGDPIVLYFPQWHAQSSAMRRFLLPEKGGRGRLGANSPNPTINDGRHSSFSHRGSFKTGKPAVFPPLLRPSSHYIPPPLACFPCISEFLPPFSAYRWPSFLLRFRHFTHTRHTVCRRHFAASSFIWDTSVVGLAVCLFSNSYPDFPRSYFAPYPPIPAWKRERGPRGRRAFYAFI